MFIKTLFTIALLSAQFSIFQINNEQPVVRAVLFYSPSCGHCHMVIEETLPPLLDQYGDQLQIIGIDVTQPQGQILFIAAGSMFKLESVGVPFLVVGNEYLVGSLDIPEQFPGLIEKYLAQGGVDWPDVPGLREAIHGSETSQKPEAAAAPSAPPAETTSTSLPTETPLTISQRIMLDPIGNSLAIVVLILMVVTFLGAVMAYQKIPKGFGPASIQMIIPLLCILGLGIASYLAYVEATQTTAICGPVGDCNTVQQSEYARLFGAIPIGVLGIIGYIAILLGWVMAKTQNENIANFARLSMFLLSTAGIIFSIYLTFLEPFVIGATCAWCITSAIVMTALFILTLRDGKQSYQRLVAAYS